jgi:SAM-dependent methyltransferase
VPDDQQVIDVERLVEDVRERVARERSEGDGTAQQLTVPEPGQPYLIGVRREAIVSNRRVVGPLITFVRRALLRILALPLQDLINQMNTAVAGVRDAVRYEGVVRQAMLEREAAARQGDEDEIRRIYQRFNGVDTVLNALELAHRLAIADEAESRERAIAEEAAARLASDEAEAEVRTRLAGDVQAVFEQLTGLGARVERLNAERRLARLERSLRAQQIDASPAAPAHDVAGERVPALDYLIFEERFRPTDTVYERQEMYVELLGDCERVVDLGCGRGELLELLRERGVPAYGVEVEGDFIDILRERGLDVVVQDALAHLQRLDPGAVDAVVALHLIEHLPSAALVGLVQEVARILNDGGILILETPNPESVVAGSVNFHRDPTHQQPVHPDTLTFLCENAGFQDVEVRRLSPVPSAERLPAPTDATDSLNAYLDRVVDQLNGLLYGFQDYAVVARR